MVIENDKKKIIIMYMILVIILGTFLFMRCTDLKVFKDDYVPQEEKQEEKKDDKKIKKNRFLSKINNSEKYANNTVKPTAPVLDFDSNYTINIGDSFELPKIIEDDAYIPSLIEITYFFKDYNSNEYALTDILDFNKLGIYKVHYKVTNHYNLTTEKDIFIETIDNVKPVIDGYIVTTKNGVKTFNPIKDNSIINKNVTISFSDNDRISYVEYYKEFMVYSKTKQEEENLMDIITLENGNDLELKDDAKYIVRAYDRSGNYSEYKIKIDTKGPDTKIKYELVKDGVLVTIKASEKIRNVNGFNKIDDYTLTKLYKNNISERIIVYDEIGNGSYVNISIKDFHKINLIQNNNITSSTQLNSLDGVIKLEVIGNSNYSLEVYLDDEKIDYEIGSSLTACGHYDVKLTSIIDTYTLSFDIADMGNID